MNFSLRIVNADFYTTAPLAGLDPVYSSFRSNKIHKVPVLRIFGSTTNGQKCCLHIHGVFPYIYVPYNGDEPKDVYLKQFATSVDFALHVSQGKASSSVRHVHDIQIVSARSFYGYHEDEREFMKVYFYNPFIVTRVVELLQNGAVMNKTFQPYESHIPYIQQMFIDYNLYGMNLINSSSVLFRTPIQFKPDNATINDDIVHSPNTPVLSPSSSSTGSPCIPFWSEETVPRHFRHTLEVERMSVCELEGDIKAENIMNQYEIGSSIGTNPGLVAIWQDERQRRLDENDETDLEPLTSQDRGDIPLLEAERQYKQRLGQIITDRSLLEQTRSQEKPSFIQSQDGSGLSSSGDIDENTPIVDQSVVHELVRSSQQSFSQVLANSTDMEMIEILASLADDQSQSRRAQDPTGMSSDDEENQNENQDDEESIMMSQQVWDDTDPANDGENSIQGSQLRMSQFDFDGLDETWEVSLLSEEPIPQLDGNNDLEEQASNISTSKKQPRSSCTTRSKRGSNDPSLNDSVSFLNEVKRRPTRRLGMSSMRLTRRLQKSDQDMNQFEQVSKKQHQDKKKFEPVKNQNEQVINQGDHVEPSKMTNQTHAGHDIGKSTSRMNTYRNYPTSNRNKTNDNDFKLYLSESNSSNEDEIFSSPVTGTKTSNEECPDAVGKIPQLTHVSDFDIPHVSVKKSQNTSPREIPHKSRKRLCLTTRTMKESASSTDAIDRKSNHKCDVGSSETKVVDLAIDQSKSVSDMPHNFTSPSTNLAGTEVPTLKVRNVFKRKRALHQDVKRLRVTDDDFDNFLQETEEISCNRKINEKQQHYPQHHQHHHQQQPKSTHKGENVYKDIKRRVFAGYKSCVKNKTDDNRTTNIKTVKTNNTVKNLSIEYDKGKASSSSSKLVTMTRKKQTNLLEDPAIDDEKGFSSYQKARSKGRSTRRSASRDIKEPQALEANKESKDQARINEAKVSTTKTKEITLLKRQGSKDIKHQMGSGSNEIRPSEFFDSKSIADQKGLTSNERRLRSKAINNQKKFTSKQIQESESVISNTDRQRSKAVQDLNEMESHEITEPIKSIDIKQSRHLNLNNKELKDVDLKDSSGIEDLFDYIEDKPKCRTEYVKKHSEHERTLLPKTTISEQQFHSNERIETSDSSAADINLPMEHQECYKNPTQNICGKSFLETKKLKIILTDVGQDESKLHLYSAALDRWKRQKSEQRKLQEFLSLSSKTSFNSLVRLSPRTPRRKLRRKTSKQSSPQGKRYGVLDITVHASPPPKSKGSPSKSYDSPSLEAKRSSPIKSNGSPLHSNESNSSIPFTPYSSLTKSKESPSLKVRVHPSTGTKCSDSPNDLKGSSLSKENSHSASKPIPPPSDYIYSLTPKTTESTSSRVNDNLQSFLSLNTLSPKSVGSSTRKSSEFRTSGSKMTENQAEDLNDATRSHPFMKSPLSKSVSSPERKSTTTSSPKSTSPNKSSNSKVKRNISAEFENSIFSNKSNEIDRLFDVLGSCFSKNEDEKSYKEAAQLPFQHEDTKPQNDEKIKENTHHLINDECSQTKSSNVTNTAQVNTKRKRHETAITSRKHPRLSLKLKPKDISKLKHDPKSLQSDITRVIKDSPEEIYPSSSQSSDSTNGSPSILNETVLGISLGDNELLNPKTSAKHDLISNNLDDNIKPLTVSYMDLENQGESTKEKDFIIPSTTTLNSPEVSNSDTPIESRNLELCGGENKNDEVEINDSVLSSSPDLFDSALYNMSYLSPAERCEKDRISPPIPCTPSRTSNNEIVNDSLTDCLTENWKPLFEGEDLKSSCPHFPSSLLANTFSDGCSETDDYSLNASILTADSSKPKLMSALLKIKEQDIQVNKAPSSSHKTALLEKNVQNADPEHSLTSGETVNRTCTTLSAIEEGSTSGMCTQKFGSKLKDVEKDGLPKNQNQISALKVLHRYCRKLEAEKMALMGLELVCSQTSVASSTKGANIHSLEDEVCSTRISELSSSSSSGSVSSNLDMGRKDSSHSSLSKNDASLVSEQRINTADFPACDACQPSSNETTTDDHVSPSISDNDAPSNEEILPIDNDLSISSDSLIPVDRVPPSPTFPNRYETPSLDLYDSSRLVVQASSPPENEAMRENKSGNMSWKNISDDYAGCNYNSSPLVSSEDKSTIDDKYRDNSRDFDKWCISDEVALSGTCLSDVEPGMVQSQDDCEDSSNHSEDIQDKQHAKRRDISLSRSYFETSTKERDIIIIPKRNPPTSTELLQSSKRYGIPQCRYQEPFYSDPTDVPENIMDVGGRLLKIQSNQVKSLPKFNTKSPFVGIQEVREMRCSSPERSFLIACQDNAGSSETFLDGLENNPELRIAFMGERSMTITPCKNPPHPKDVRSWAIEKLLKKRTQMSNKDDKVQSAKDEPDIKEMSKEKMISSDDEKKQVVDSNKNIDCDKEKTSDVSEHRIANTVGDNLIAKAEICDGSFVSYIESKQSSPDTNKKDELTSPNTLFSPVAEESFKYSPDNQHKNAVDNLEPKEAGTKDLPFSERGSSREISKNKGSTNQQNIPEMVLPFHSTPLPSRKAKLQNDASPDSYSTPAVKRGSLPLPLLTPIPAALNNQSPNLLSSEKKPVDSSCKISADKRRNHDGASQRQLLLSQLKLCTPEVALRRRISEAGSEIDGPSPINTAGYKVPQLNIQDAKANHHEVQHLTLLSVELHIRTRKDRKPDPEFDPICALFYHAQTDSPCPTSKVTGIICVDKSSAEMSNTRDISNNLTGLDTTRNSSSGSGNSRKRALLARSGVTQYHVHYVQEEKDLFQAFLSLVRKWDPDILIGYEIQMLSWGYLIQRALVFDLDLGKLLSRVIGSSSESNIDAEKDQWGARHTHELKIGGRVILNVWRLMRHEAALNVYTFENVTFHVLHQRVPLFTFRSLSDWWDHKTDLYRWRTVDHYVTRCRGNIRLLEQVDFIGRTSELARLFGILFYSVISRGSQFRVESMMLRISKPLKYVAISPSVQQRNSMNAPEVIPLVLEPESRLYNNPVLVLDFQSLYPSMIIAYNYCYSTCLGRVSGLEELGEFKFGAATHFVPPGLLKKLEDDIHISPNGVAFVKSSVRLGVLPKMLEDILNTRIMVKNSMKKWKNKKSIHRMLDARQLGLKLIANVTYGYTAAHFSGRMPCVEVGDSIVRKARETLEHAIHVVNSTSRWGARVVYGDTDSMFVLLDGASKDEAFRIGREIVETVTAMNPKPVKLKFEKVYLPCVLQTKKRYVGYMYETPDQKEPVFDAKGIETVRRDSCPAVAKVLEKSLRVLFETKDVSLIKHYVQRQFTKVMEGRVSLQDLTFAKEYRGMATYKPGACVPALELTRRMLKEDRRSEPRVGERVPYVIVYGSPGSPLIKLVRRPLEVLQDPGLRINALYYITKQLIPPLNRAFCLIGVDVSTWFAEVPRTSRVRVQPFTSTDTRKKTISHYFNTTNCPVCQQTTTAKLCDACAGDPQKVVITLNDEIRQHEKRHRQLAEICYSCSGSRDTRLCCVSIDCPVFHKLVKATRDLEPANHLREIISTILK